MKNALISILFAAAAGVAEAVVAPATPFTDNMVLQRGRPVPVWGRASSGETVVVTFAGQKKIATAGTDGAWRVTLDAMEASRENRTMCINEIEIKNVLVGEVWFASGQSNMECPIWGKNPRYRDAKGGMMTQMTRRPLIRYIKNARNSADEPQLDLKAQWLDFSPESFKAKELSAVAFYYALELYGALEIPVGIIDSSWGGSRIEPWTPRAPGETAPSVEHKAATMFNGMVAAYAPFAIRGLIWYQGCSNSGDGERYAAKMRALYDGWAREFENPALRFYFVQLAPYRNDYRLVRLAQAAFAEEEENAAIAIICDAGNLDDIHPNDKEIVAKRLALHALKRDYGWTWITDDSPTLKSFRVEDGRFVLSFKDATAWYVYRADGSYDVPGFEIAGPDGVFVPAKVMNENADKRGTFAGAELVIASDGVTEPKQLRYLATKPWTGALYALDSALPLGPFEIDARRD